MVSHRVPLPHVRLSPGAWPKLPGEQSSQAKRSRSLDMDVHGTGEGQDADYPAATSRKDEAVTVSDGYQVSKHVSRLFLQCPLICVINHSDPAKQLRLGYKVPRYASELERSFQCGM